jgi:negative regulator of sigma E activity
MSTTHPDEIIFALFYDGELDQEEETHFIESLKSDPELREQYDHWVETLEAMQEHIIAQEGDYPLTDFSDRVMAALPEEAPQRSSQPPLRVEMEAEADAQSSFISWFKQAWIPALIGGIAAALVLVVMQQLNAPSRHLQTSTTLISLEEDQEQSGSETTVIWVVDDESDEEDENKEDDGI